MLPLRGNDRSTAGAVCPVPWAVIRSVRNENMPVMNRGPTLGTVTKAGIRRGHLWSIRDGRREPSPLTATPRWTWRVTVGRAPHNRTYKQAPTYKTGTLTDRTDHESPLKYTLLIGLHPSSRATTRELSDTSVCGLAASFSPPPSETQTYQQAQADTRGYYVSKQSQYSNSVLPIPLNTNR
jgi:hypothetical protein